MLLVDSDRHGTGYITDIVYCLYIMQMIAELTLCKWLLSWPISLCKIHVMGVDFDKETPDR